MKNLLNKTVSLLTVGALFVAILLQIFLGGLKNLLDALGQAAKGVSLERVSIFLILSSAVLVFSLVLSDWRTSPVLIDPIIVSQGYDESARINEANTNTGGANTKKGQANIKTAEAGQEYEGYTSQIVTSRVRKNAVRHDFCEV